MGGGRLQRPPLINYQIYVKKGFHKLTRKYIYIYIYIYTYIYGCASDVLYYGSILAPSLCSYCFTPCDDIVRDRVPI